MSYIRFTPDGRSKSGKTFIWQVETDGGNEYLGQISWYAPWRCYSFIPVGTAIFEKDCLREIAMFCEGATIEHKQRKTEEKKT